MDNRVAGKRICALRQARGLTQQQLAAMMNVSHQAVSKWESGLALPDIQTMLELTRFFGITVEQLFADEDAHEQGIIAQETGNTDVKDDTEQETKKEVRNMNIQQLLQMAPFMSKAAVEEIALGIEENFTAAQLAKLAPYISAEGVSKLVEKHRPQFSWESLKKIAPFMDRDAVDALARAIASGEETVKPAGDNLNRTFNDLGKAFDSFGRDMGHAFDDFGRKAKKGVKKAIRFGGKVINEVSTAISDLGEDLREEKPAPERSEKLLAIRKKAFERAIADERWDWIAAHIAEIQDDADLRAKIVARAKELGMHDWICKNMGGVADEDTVKAAIEAENWEWLGENTWLLAADLQQRVALAAMKAANWDWLSMYAEQLDLKSSALEIAQAALAAGEKQLAAELANAHLTQPEAAVLAREACNACDYDALEMLLDAAGMDCLAHLLESFAESGQWETALRFAGRADAQLIEKLMEIAVDQGNFDAIDQLDDRL